MRALACLKVDRFAFVADIAEQAHVPPAYLAKIFKKLSDAGIIESRRGPGGGNRLAMSSEEITLLDIAKAVDGPDWIGECLFGARKCEGPDLCPSHVFWEIECKRITRHLKATTLAEIIRMKTQNELVR
ncbi:MAG: Rrf2 family transcriptional regulator [Opitutales bacterium]|nr:Rrf2 family transcriptional regulator [Opitutales bacterium]